MSWASSVWAQRQEIGPGDSAGGKFGRALLKWLLVALADYEQGTGEVYASIAALAEKTEMDGKTVQTYLAELARRGFIADTGRRVGRTKQIPVYQLVGFDPDFAFAARKAQAKNPAHGAVCQESAPAAGNVVQGSDSKGPSGGGTACVDAAGQTAPSTGGFDSETTPWNTSNDPVEHAKGPRRRGTELSSNLPKEPSEARAPARGSARPRGPEPEQERPKPTAEQILGAWRNRLGPILVTEISLLLWGRGVKVSRSWPAWPAELQGLFLASLQGVADDAANLEISRGACSPEMRVNADNAAQAAAADVASRYAAIAAVAA